MMVSCFRSVKDRSPEALIEFALSSPDTCSPTALRQPFITICVHTAHTMHAAHWNPEALIVSTISKLQRVAVLMASENLCSAVPQHRRSPLGSNQPSGQDGREIELLKSRAADLERKFDESRNEVRQLMTELEMLQQTTDQRNQQVEPLENEIGYIIYDEIQLQVGWPWSTNFRKCVTY